MKLQDDELVAVREAYSNKVNQELTFTGKRVVTMTLRSATFDAPVGRGRAEISVFTPTFSSTSGRTIHVGYEEVPETGKDISKAEILLSVGRGIGDEENLTRLECLADKLGATLACSRPVVDAGWLPKGCQVGQSGKIASNCKVYVALGISGAVQHLAGMKHVETVIAINKDPSAAIFNVAKFGVVSDLFEIVEALEQQLP